MVLYGNTVQGNTRPYRIAHIYTRPYKTVGRCCTWFVGTINCKVTKPEKKKAGSIEVVSKELTAGNVNMGAVGPALAPKGINLQKFISEFNNHEYSQKFKGEPIMTKLMIDTSTKAFSFKLYTPQASYLIRKATGIAKGSGNPGREGAGSITCEQILSVAKVKHQDYLGVSNVSIAGVCKSIAGTARSMGIKVAGNLDEFLAKLDPAVTEGA